MHSFISLAHKANLSETFYQRSYTKNSHPSLFLLSVVGASPFCGRPSLNLPSETYFQPVTGVRSEMWARTRSNVQGKECSIGSEQDALNHIQAARVQFMRGPLWIKGSAKRTMSRLMCFTEAFTQGGGEREREGGRGTATLEPKHHKMKQTMKDCWWPLHATYVCVIQRWKVTK